MLLSVCFWAAAVLAGSSFAQASYPNTGSTGYSCPTLFNFYGDLYDCRKFYRCFWGEAYEFNCPAGTRWNQAILTCDHEYNVPCRGGDLTVHVNYEDKSHYGDSYDYPSAGHYDDGYSKATSTKHYQPYDTKRDQSYNDYGGHYYQPSGQRLGGYNDKGYYDYKGYYDGGHQTQNLALPTPARIAYYDYKGQPSYISYTNNHRGYYNPHDNFLAYNSFMAALGYRRK